MRIIPIICVLPLLGLSACTYLAGKLGGLHPSQEKAIRTIRVGEAKVVGVIELVNPEQNYVLINCEQRLHIPAGTEVISQKADGSKTKLKVTPERKGNYITADIIEGSPDVRDLVLVPDQTGRSPGPRSAARRFVLPRPPNAGAAVPLTPIMQADVIPPLGTPFQPMAPAQPSLRQRLRRLPATLLRLPPKHQPEPADLSKLLPVVR
jgi:hypothetical protein